MAATVAVHSGGLDYNRPGSALCAVVEPVDPPVCVVVQAVVNSRVIGTSARAVSLNSFVFIGYWLPYG